ncbi:helix-turn-helix transcriptional regulator [Candidatus Woesearchaeota archaeon]|jgi:hypothetical protein|nr:helix-turn-helix transcriptional regulator [Candidatus Woesearchaeota archaeon]MBT4151377.1 helix-turn-helix transcriptional regulator [Candidatus Woesearchaeota archaeon]MBT4247775.1 helix-turn-helix transcriptional regulator [Candidatus Woesearchaeota archaeon]MBT4434199.1 helix-turn-helix transcriptional regulator [Candidatus Woesearchaeota archaeon]MBT7332331.1 helix-turn-helix transcriptional regulator [Candidatus Woesearchaeota archaeon]
MGRPKGLLYLEHITEEELDLLKVTVHNYGYETQHRLAQAICIGRPTIQKIYSGERKIREELVGRLLEACNYDPRLDFLNSKKKGSSHMIFPPSVTVREAQDLLYSAQISELRTVYESLRDTNKTRFLADIFEVVDRYRK